MQDTGLTPFILAMMRAPTDKLAGADVARLASKYEIPETTAAAYLAAWLKRGETR